jgi:trans-aconitate 2-methyltransferase
VRPDDPEPYFATVILGSHLERVAPERRAGFVRDVLRELGEPDIRYVRLNISARRPT